MALMEANLTPLIEKSFRLGRIHRHAHSGLRFLVKSSGFASALGQKSALGQESTLGQKVVRDASKACSRPVCLGFQQQLIPP
jgi:hypothetical protein